MAEDSRSELISKLNEIEDVDEIDPVYNRTPLHEAARRGNELAVNHLIGRGADVGIRDKDDLTALHYAVRKGNPAIVRALLAAGADASADGLYINDPITVALKTHGAESVPIVDALIEHGASINAMHDGATPLHHLAQEENAAETIRVAISRGADVNAASDDIDGNTPLHDALSFLKTDNAVALIENGASLHARNKHGDTPLDVLPDMGVFRPHRRRVLDAHERYMRQPWRYQKPVEFADARDTILTTLACAKRNNLRLPLEMWQLVFSKMNREDFGADK